MTDPMASLLRLQSPTNVGNRPAYTPNIGRNNAQAAMLGKMLGLPDDGSISQADMQSTYDEAAAAQTAAEQQKAQLATLPDQIKGQYGLAQEEMKGQYGVRAAQAQADRAAQEHETAREFQAGQNDLGRRAVNTRMDVTNRNVVGRQDQAARNTGINQQIARIGAGKENAPRPAGEGFFSRWLTGPSQTDLNQQRVTQLQGQIGQPAPGGGSLDQALVSQAIQYLSSNPGTTLDDLMAAGNDFSPEELAAIQGQLNP